MVEFKSWFTRLEKLPAQEATDYINKPRLLETLRWLLPVINQVNAAHVVMLEEQGLLDTGEAAEILKATEKLMREGAEALHPLIEYQDLYFNVEGYIMREAGAEVGGKMHIARSRNDLGATEYRIFVREQLLRTMDALILLEENLISVAEREAETVMPGYTHLQQAQPITFGYWALAYADMLHRSLERLRESYKRVNLNPLGAAALAGTSFPIDRKRTAELLGFGGLIENGLDAVSSRDFICDVVAALAIAVTDVSRLCEDLIIFHSWEFKLVELADEYCGSSSIMPQKKNPSTLEACRAKAGRVCGALSSILTILKGLPSGVSIDLWETLKPFSEAVDQSLAVFNVVSGNVAGLRPNKEAMMEKLQLGFSQATDLADLLVKDKGLSFRAAHKIVGRLVLDTVKAGVRPAEVTKRMLDDAAQAVMGEPVGLEQEKIAGALNPLLSVKERRVRGGTAPEEVKRMAKDRREKMRRERLHLNEMRGAIDEARTKLEAAIQRATSRESRAHRVP